jgi:hypothetical protein
MQASRVDRVRPVASLQEFFRDSVDQAMQRQGLTAGDHTAYYVVSLLTLFARSDPLYEETQAGLGLKPLALMLAEAAERMTRCRYRPEAHPGARPSVRSSQNSRTSSSVLSTY